MQDLQGAPGFCYGSPQRGDSMIVFDFHGLRLKTRMSFRAKGAHKGFLGGAKRVPCTRFATPRKTGARAAGASTPGDGKKPMVMGNKHSIRTDELSTSVDAFLSYHP